jgi:hypothetical protein
MNKQNKESLITSVKVTKIFIILVAVASMITCIVGPKIVSYVTLESNEGVFESPWLTGYPRFWIIIIGGYICAIILFVMLYQLYRLVVRIDSGEVFSERNVRSLKIISDVVLMACVLTFIMGITCGFFILLICAAAAFMTAIIRVVMNAFSKAVEMKDELDYTV